VEIAMLAKY